MPRVQLSFDAAACADPLATISAELPDVAFTVLSSYPTADGILGLIEIETQDAAGSICHFDDAPELSYEVIHTDEQTTVIQYKIPENEASRALRGSGSLPRFPAHLQNGWLSAEHAAPQEQLPQFFERLATADIPYLVRSMTRSHDPNELLTNRQREIVTEAVERGYYESPRGCTLTELAETFDVNKSAASGVLRRAERRIITEYIEPLPPGTPDSRGSERTSALE